MMAVRNKWAINDSERIRWEEWFKDFAPQSNDVNEYINASFTRQTKLRFYVPCRNFILYSNQLMEMQISRLQ
jgi:hypothetical protein